MLISWDEIMYFVRAFEPCSYIATILHKIGMLHMLVIGSTASDAACLTKSNGTLDEYRCVASRYEASTMHVQNLGGGLCYVQSFVLPGK
jgi:hypothetical protein